MENAGGFGRTVGGNQSRPWRRGQPGSGRLSRELQNWGTGQHDNREHSQERYKQNWRAGHYGSRSHSQGDGLNDERRDWRTNQRGSQERDGAGPSREQHGYRGTRTLNQEGQVGESQRGRWNTRGFARGGRRDFGGSNTNLNRSSGYESDESNTSHHDQKRTSRPDRVMGFKYVEDLLENSDPQTVLFKLSNDSNGFKKLLDDRDISGDMIVSLIRLLQLVCASDFQNIQTELLTSVLRSRFMDKLNDYIGSIMLQSVQQRKRNTYFWNDPDEFWTNLIIISKTVTVTIPSNCETIQKLLNVVTTFIPLIERDHAIHISDSIKNNARDLLEIVKQTIEDMEVKRPIAHVPRRQGVLDDSMEPPNDFREIDIMPRVDEVTVNQLPFLRTNVIDKPYKDIDHYLDVQYRLLREDFIAPLRRGICSHLQNTDKPKDIKIYKKIKFLNVETLNECNCYRIQMDSGKGKQTFKYENSKRFMFGSLVCFTNDNFATVLFGKIVDRDERLLKNFQLIVGFQDEVVIQYDKEYLMVESSVYFEPYYQVLGALKRMSTDVFPMEKYIIKIETDSRPPGYLSRSTIYNVEEVGFDPLQFPINRRFYGLNDSQLTAFRASLTREFCIIQGPPGTGKTHLGLKIARTLIQNRHAWYNQTPILVICFTNHALDQFLEGLLPVTKQILRVGGQSKNENLREFNLASKRVEYHKKERVEKAILQRRDEVRKFMMIIKTLNETRNRIAANDSVINFAAFRDIEGYRTSWFARASQEDIRKWLLDGARSIREKPMQQHIHAQIEEGIIKDEVEDEDEEKLADLDEDENRQVNVDDIFENIKVRSDGSLISLVKLQEHIKTLNNAMDDLTNQPENLNNILEKEKLQLELWETESYLDCITIQLARYKVAKESQNRLRPLHIDFRNPFSMTRDDRWLLYFYWLDIYLEQLRDKFQEFDVQFKEVYRVYNEMREMEDTQIMKQNVVVGMTTTGAARLQTALKAIRSPIVIVEEAAEVLEAHIVAALTNHCKHLILIGDHLQLKPGAADYRVEKTYRLGISLFERMVNNKIECHTLNTQHRMKPEISRLIKPHIYPNLEDHESTLDRPPILGIPKCLYFIDHTEKEDLCQDASKRNIHEAKFLIALARHLILNGYKPAQITILAAYLGQMFEMVREKKKPDNFMLLQDVRISVLDNYQGEECDIILLSLVRSNSEDIAGFLKIQNRVCVALSRARDGFYIMGNMTLLLNSKSENKIWNNVHQVLQNQDAIGTYLTLQCQMHPYRLTKVAKSEDFNKIVEGGCDLSCGTKVGCGHICKRRCHVQDRDHILYKCMEKCNKLLCNDRRHPCRKLCFEECGPCTYVVPRILECEHTIHLECHIDPDKYACQVLVLTKLPCDHQEQKPCYIDAIKFKCPHPCDTRVEPCGHACTSLCHAFVDPDHLKYRCAKPCARPRVGCTQIADPHTCTKYCYQDCEDCLIEVQKERSCGHVYKIACKLDVEIVKCERPCKKLLPCGHPCKKKCLEECGPCEVKVEKVIPECLHKVQIQCKEIANRQHCKSPVCPRLLQCGHKCTKSCQSVCTEKCEEIVKCNIRSSCGHRITKIQCHLKNTVDPKILIRHCTNPCGVELTCKHMCSGTCGECLQSRIHKRCAEKCGVPLVCNHECPIPCREACKPCTLPCGMKCEHSKCKKKCGEPCTPCTSPCSRQCEHVHCDKSCGAICDVSPCTERCKKMLKCRHPCVGFCNDPCPTLCGICNKEELTEVFLGSEDEPDAIYVMLSDCGHIFESSDLDEWLNQNENEIKFKVCPRCTTNITTTSRYSNYIKRALQDVVLAKEKSFGTGTDNETLTKELAIQLLALKQRCSQVQLNLVFRKLKEPIEMLEMRLKPTVGNRRQAINNVELTAIKSKLQTLSYIVECFEGVKYAHAENDASIFQLNLFLGVLLRSIDHVTDQEIEDLELEIKRLHRTVQYEQIKKSITDLIKQSRLIPYKPSVKADTMEKKLIQFLFAICRYDESADRTTKLYLTAWSTELKSSIPITDKERMEIVKAMGLAKGHWYKCPNGHPYVIGNCGGANQIAKCFCGEDIGGTHHALLRSNQHAGEMDDSQRHAWPGGLHGVVTPKGH